MIKLSITTFIFLYSLCSVIVILILWIVSNYRKRITREGKEIDYIWKCSVCLNTYIDSKHEDMSVCPVCASYNKKEIKKGVRQ